MKINYQDSNEIIKLYNENKSLRELSRNRKQSKGIGFIKKTFNQASRKNVKEKFNL